MERQNSQQKQSLTCILAVGDLRSLLFQLMRRRTKEKKEKASIKLPLNMHPKNSSCLEDLSSSYTHVANRINKDLDRVLFDTALAYDLGISP